MIDPRAPISMTAEECLEAMTKQWTDLGKHIEASTKGPPISGISEARMAITGSHGRASDAFDPNTQEWIFKDGEITEYGVRFLSEYLKAKQVKK